MVLVEWRVTVSMSKNPRRWVFESCGVAKRGGFLIVPPDVFQSVFFVL